MTQVHPSAVIGRRSQLAVLDIARRDAAEGTGRIVLVCGEPGIGKTRLVEEAARRARADGFTVAWASCWEGDGAPPLWPWTQVLDGLGAAATIDVGAVDAGSGAGVAGAARFPVYAAVLAALEDACARFGQVMLVFDDLHWADGDSTAMLAFVALRLRALPLAIVAAFRPDEMPERDLATLTRVGEPLALGGLTVDEVAELVGVVSGRRPSASAAAALRARCDGNPLFVRELSRLLEGRPDTSPDTVAVPASVRAVLERRLVRVEQPAVEMLQVLAVLGVMAPIT
ncbi:MAG TPA: AAA family ATPase, partial [Acidimicrobiales bacterium]|nr:AAA family ATPase [Acidimicrobiales bacterium]